LTLSLLPYTIYLSQSSHSMTHSLLPYRYLSNMLPYVSRQSLLYILCQRRWRTSLCLPWLLIYLLAPKPHLPASYFYHMVHASHSHALAITKGLYQRCINGSSFYPSLWCQEMLSMGSPLKFGTGPHTHMNYHFSVHRTTINNSVIACNTARCHRLVFHLLVKFVHSCPP